MTPSKIPQTFDSDSSLRHAKVGQGVRQFIHDRVIPFIQETSDIKFFYRFHDLRASFGMNLTEQQLQLIERGQVKLHQVREFVKTRMGHTSATVTDRYLQHRKNLELARHAQYQYEEHLKRLSKLATEGLV